MKSVEQSSANLARLAKDERVRRTLVTGAIVLALAVIVLFLRLYRLSELPPGIINDEGADGIYALQVLQGEHAPFFPERSSGREAVGVYTIALTTLLFGRSLLAFHLPTALASAATVFVVFWLGQLLFGRDEESGLATPWRGLLVGGVGAGLMAVAVGQTFIARSALRANFLPLVLSLCLALLWWGWRERNWWGIVLAGVCAGLLPQTYIPGRFTPLLFLFIAVSSLVPLRTDLRRRLRAELPWASVFVGVTGLVAAPLLIYFALHPEHFFIRSSEIFLFSQEQSSPLQVLLKKAYDYLLIFGFRGDSNMKYNFAGLPMLNAWQAFFFWTGVAASLWRWRRRATYRLLLFWLCVMIAPALVTRSDGPNSLRMIGAAPAVFLLVGVGIWETYRFLKVRFFQEGGNRASTGSATTFAATTVAATTFAATIVCGAILVQGVLTYRIYFHEWVGTGPFFTATDAEIADAALVLNEQSSEADTAYLIPYYLTNGHFGFDYLYQGAAPAHVIHATTTHLPQRVESALATTESLSKVMVVDWNDDLDWTGHGEERTLALLDKYGRYLGSDQYANFQIHTYTDVSLERRWTYYEQLEPPTIHYDGGIAFMGFAMGNDEGQLSTEQRVDLGQERVVWVALQWRVAPEMNFDYAISLRLKDADGGGPYQRDIVILDPKETRTSRWQADELVDTLYELQFPADMLPGDYELRMIVYDYETLKPTVELGVWELETTLARLRFDQAD